MGAKYRVAGILTLLMLAMAGVAAAGATASAGAQRAKKCAPARSARCLKLARGREPVLVSSRGRISRDQALQVFVQTIGPLPGVKPLSGAVDRRAFSSGSGPLRWAAAYLPAMTRAQRAAFKRLISGGSGRLHAHLAGGPTLATTKKWKQAAQTVVGLLSQHLGVSLTSPPALPFDVKMMPAPDPDGAAIQAAAVPLDKNGNWATGLGPGVHCQIQIFPIAWKSSNPELPITVVSHEAVHCFQFKLNSPVYATLAESPWLLEGGAEWAGDQVAREVLGHDPKDQYLSAYWNAYLGSPSVDLFTRVYDAVGFFAHMAETAQGGNLWPTLREMFKAKGPTAAYAIGVPDSNTDFLDSWASGYARNPGLGPGWDTTGIGITPKKPPIPFYSSGSASLSAGPRASAIARLQVGGQVLVVGGSGGTPFGRLRDASGSEFDLGPASYCVTGQDCTCPSGTPGYGDSIPEIAPGVAWVALSGNNAAANLTLARMTVTNWCQHPTGGNPGGVSHIVVSGGASATSFQNGHGDTCTIHQSNPFPPGLELQCVFEMVEPGGEITQASVVTFHYTGTGFYHVTDRGTTTGPDVGYADLAASYAATWNPPPDQFDAGGFTIASVSGGRVTGSINATLGNVSQPEDSPTTVSESGTFSVPLQIVP